MRRRINASLSIEAQIIFPIILFIFYMIIMVSLRLFMRCHDSQENFIRELRQIRSEGCSEASYEVIYGQKTYEKQRTEHGVNSMNPLRLIAEERNGN